MRVADQADHQDQCDEAASAGSQLLAGTTARRRAAGAGPSSGGAPPAAATGGGAAAGGVELERPSHDVAGDRARRRWRRACRARRRPRWRRRVAEGREADEQGVVALDPGIPSCCASRSPCRARPRSSGAPASCPGLAAHLDAGASEVGVARGAAGAVDHLAHAGQHDVQAVLRHAERARAAGAFGPGGRSQG